VVDNGPGLRGKTEDELFAFWDADVLDSRGLPRLRPKSLAVRAVVGSLKSSFPDGVPWLLAALHVWTAV
jgi:hypothetical protein